MSLALCGILKRLAAVGLITLVGRVPLGGVLGALAVLAWRLGALSEWLPDLPGDCS